MPHAYPLIGKLLGGLTLAILVGCDDARAAGFGIDFEGARAVGMATAGSASPMDAATIFYNPAGMTFLQRPDLVGGGQLFLFHDRFSNSGSTILGGTLSTPGGNGSDAIPTTPIPWLFATYPVKDTWSAGIGVFAPFGLKTDYGPNFVGRYQNQLAALTAIDVNPAIAYRAVPWLSLGAGLTVEYVKLELQQAIDFASSCFVALGGPTCGAAFGLQPGKNDGDVDIKGSDVALGYSLGLLVEVAPRTRLGLSYRSRIDHNITAQESFDVPAGARALLAAGGTPTALTGSTVNTTLPLPARWVFGATESFANGLDVSVDIVLTQWGIFRTTAITAQNPATGASVVVTQGYQDAWRFALGVNYSRGDRWSVRAGLAYDQTPIKPEFVQAALPDRDRMYFSVGASYRFTQRWSADLGYVHVRYAGRVPIDRSTANGDRLRGDFDVGGDIVALQARFEK